MSVSSLCKTRYGTPEISRRTLFLKAHIYKSMTLNGRSCADCDEDHRRPFSGAFLSRENLFLSRIWPTRATAPGERQAAQTSLLLGIFRNAGMVQILLGILAAHLAFVATNGAFHNNFGSGSRRSVHIGWGHTFQATRSKAVLQHESTSAGIFTRFSRVQSQRPARLSSVSYNFRVSGLRCGILRLPVK